MTDSENINSSPSASAPTPPENVPSEPRQPVPQPAAVSSPVLHAETQVPFTLPSMGVPYRDALPDGKVLIRSMTGSDEAILSSTALDDVEKTSRIIKSCTAFSNRFDPLDLLMTDRIILLMGIRAHTLSPIYRVTAKDPQTGRPFTADVNILEDIGIHPMPRTHTDSDGVEREYRYDPDEGISVTLPRSGKKAVLRLLTGRDEAIIARELKKGPDSSLLPPFVFDGRQDPSFYLRNVLAIRAWSNASGELVPVNHSKPQQFQAMCRELGNLPYFDMLMLDREYGRWDVGVDLTVPVTTPSGEEVRLPIAISAEFFRPTNL